jgi:capsular polysaccharide biosynthesis protein
MGETKELNLKELFSVLVKKAWAIALSAVIAAALFLGYTIGFVTPLYTTGVSVYINNNTSSLQGYISSSDLSVALRLVNTYANIIKSDNVLEKVIKEGNFDLTTNQIRGMLAAGGVKDTEIVVFEVTHPDPQLAAKIANTVATVAEREIPTIIDGSTAKVIDYAKVPTVRSSPSYTKNAIIGFLLGTLLSCAVIIIRSMLDVRIKSEEDLAKICSAPVLGLIPDLSGEVRNAGKNVRKNSGRGKAV